MSSNIQERIEAAKKPETHKFMNVRLDEFYSDADVKHDVHNLRDFFIPATISEPAETLKHNINYKRTIPVKTIPKGSMLFTYATLRPPPQYVPPELQAHYIFAKLLTCMGINCEFDSMYNNSYRFEYCSYDTENTYYYPNPCAGFGIAGKNTKNCCVAVITQRDLDVAYLKEGASREELSVSSKIKITSKPYPKNVDYRRIRQCADMTRIPGLCGAREQYDVCLNPDFMRSNNLAGYTTLAYQDAIANMKPIKLVTTDFTKYETEYKLMGTRYTNWLDSVVKNGSPEEDLYLHNMNLLCIESDRIDTIQYVTDGNLYFGFPEYFINGFGEIDISTMINGDFFNDPLISVKSFLESQNGKNIRMAVYVKPENIEAFLEKFIYPYSAVRAFNMFTVEGAAINFNLGFDSIPKTFPAPKPTALGRFDYEYKINHYISSALFSMKDIFKYDLIKNLILITDYTLSDRAEPFTGARKVDAENKTVTDIPKGYYDITIDDINALNRALQIKLHHEVIGNISPDYFRICFMREYAIQDFGDSSEEYLYRIPVGPFYSPLKLDIVVSDDNNDFVNRVNDIIGIDETKPEYKQIKKLIFQLYTCYNNLQWIFNKLNEQLFDPTTLLTFPIEYAVILSRIVSSQRSIHPPQKPLNLKLVTKSNGSTIYNAPFYNGEWIVHYDPMRKAHGPILPPGYVPPVVQVGLPLGQLPPSALPTLANSTGIQVGLPLGQLPLPKLQPSVFPPAGISLAAPTGFNISPITPLNVGPKSRNKLPRLPASINGLSPIITANNNNAEIPPLNLNNLNSKKGGRLNVASPLRNSNILKRNNFTKGKFRNSKNKNMKNKTRRNTNNNRNRKMNANTQYPQPVAPAAINAYNNAVKMGLLNNFFVKFSGKPLKYKTAN